MKLKKLVKNIYSNSYIIVVYQSFELFRGFASHLLENINKGEFDNRKLSRIEVGYNNNTNTAFIKIYVK